MTVSGEQTNYEEILVSSLRADLEWLEREFELQFKFKKEKTNEDISLGNQILDNVIDSIKTNNCEELHNLLATTLNRIEQTYPEFF